MTIEIVIKDIPPSNNQFMGRGSRNYQAFTYQEEKRKWAWMIKAVANKKRPKEPIKKSIVTITYYFPTRHRRDPDNYSGKFILDGLVEVGIIKDDSFNCIDLKLIGKHDKKNPRTEVKVEEVKNE